MSVIVTLSGGKASAYCADWAFKNYLKDEIILYFNDTLWEHKDLYRFLDDLEAYFHRPIVRDSDGRSPEDVFYDEGILGNNRVPICSRILKAERLQKFYKDGDTLIFGIGYDERHRAKRLEKVYQMVAVKSGKAATLRFPLIEQPMLKSQIDEFFVAIGIKQPVLYTLGFLHNNCSGGCVRAGERHWAKLLEELPDVYAERERMEEEFRAHTGKDVSILKTHTLKSLREAIERQDVFDFGPDDGAVECIGICDSQE